MVFVVERQTTKFLPTKQYHVVLGCGLVYHNDEKFSTVSKNLLLTKILQKYHYNMVHDPTASQIHTHLSQYESTQLRNCTYLVCP